MLSLPPSRPNDLTPPAIITKRLKPLIGMPFKLTGKSRTDGSAVRKMVMRCLEDYYSDEPAYLVEPTCAEKGVPRIKRELLDTYIVTSGSSYNLQIWNRIPDSDNILIDYGKFGALTCRDVRLIFVKINSDTEIIESIVIASPDEIVRRFGKFGVPTIKWQLIISDSMRQEIINSRPPILVEPDLLPGEILGDDISYHAIDMNAKPEAGKIVSIEDLIPVFMEDLLGNVFEQEATKNRGQRLEYSVINLLNYDIDEDAQLAGGYPDLPNQALEIKIQDSPTVDLGKYSPQYKTDIFPDLGINTQNMRYLIALMNRETGVVEGLILVPGKSLGDYFSYVADKNFKCQRSIPMTFFDEFKGESIFIG